VFYRLIGISASAISVEIVDNLAHAEGFELKTINRFLGRKERSKIATYLCFGLFKKPLYR